MDGRQHFEDVPYWSSKIEVESDLDAEKVNLCISNKLHVVRIPQPDLWRLLHSNPDSIFSALEKTFELLLAHEKPTCGVAREGVNFPFRGDKFPYMEVNFLIWVV